MPARSARGRAVPRALRERLPLHLEAGGRRVVVRGPFQVHRGRRDVRRSQPHGRGRDFRLRLFLRRHALHQIVEHGRVSLRARLRVALRVRLGFPGLARFPRLPLLPRALHRLDARALRRHPLAALQPLVALLSLPPVLLVAFVLLVPSSVAVVVAVAAAVPPRDAPSGGGLAPSLVRALGRLSLLLPQLPRALHGRRAFARPV